MKEVNYSKNLFSEFPKTNNEKWKKKVVKDLPGADFEKNLVWQTIEGFELNPYYSKKDMHDLDYLKKFENNPLNSEEGLSGRRYWTFREKIIVEDTEAANKEAMHALLGGADGVIFDISNKKEINLGILLNNMFSLQCSISFVVNRNAAKLVRDYFSYVGEKYVDNTLLSGSFNYDPIRNLTLTGEKAIDGFKEVMEIINVSALAKQFYGLTVNGAYFSNSGANLVQELAFSLNVAVDYIDHLGELGLSAETVIRNMEFSMAIGTDYFLEIAKLRALRILFYKIAESYGFTSYDPGDLSIHSISSRWTKTLYDPHVNMLRHTTEAMSAIIGGCNALTITPYTEQVERSSAFSGRVSRNVSHILKEESYFDKVTNPSAGSYYIENITDKIVKHAWELFKEVEGEGGFIKSYMAGKIQSRIKEIRTIRLKSAAQRSEIFIGTNQYPNTQEQLKPLNIKSVSKKSEEKNVLIEGNGAIQFEELRLTTDTYAKIKGSRPKAYLARIGHDPVTCTTRAQFSSQFLGCGGFEIVDSIEAGSYDEAINKALLQDADITVICGGDDDYSVLGVEFARKFRKNKKEGVLVLTGYPLDILEELREAGIDEFIHSRANLIDTLTNIQQKLNII